MNKRIPSPTPWLVTLLVLACATLLIPDALAQEAEAPTGGTDTTLLGLIKQGGLWMIPLFILSIAGATFTIRNFLALKRDRIVPPATVALLAEQIAGHDVDGAMQTCNASPSLLTSVIGAGLERITGEHLDLENIKTAIEEADTEQMVTYMAPISYLSIIGAVSPMVGLLGTVSGMIKAFNNMSIGGSNKAELLASNIGEALVTTAGGLVVAIPSMLLYFFFKNSFMKSMAVVGRVTGGLLDALQTGIVPEAMVAQFGPSAGAAPAAVAEAEEE